MRQISQTELKLRERYADNFDYPTGLKVILKLLDDVKAYMQDGKPYVIYQMAEFIQK